MRLAATLLASCITLPVFASGHDTALPPADPQSRILKMAAGDPVLIASNAIPPGFADALSELDTDDLIARPAMIEVLPGTPHLLVLFYETWEDARDMAQSGGFDELTSHYIQLVGSEAPWGEQSFTLSAGQVIPVLTFTINPSADAPTALCLARFVGTAIYTGHAPEDFSFDDCAGAAR